MKTETKKILSADEYLKSDDCPNLKGGFKLDELQMSILAKVMETYADYKHQSKLNEVTDEVIEKN